MEFNFALGEELNDPLLADDTTQENTFIHDINRGLQAPLTDIISTPIPDDSYESNYQNAALFCKDALHGRDIIRLISKHSKRIHTIYHNQYYVYFYILVTILLMLNALLETPSTIFYERTPGLLNTYIVSGIEAILLIFVTLDIRMQYVIESEGSISFFKLDRTLLISIIVVSLNWLNVILRFIYPPIPHIFRCLRPWFFIRRRRNVRNIGAGIVKTIPQVSNIFFLLFVHLMFFSIFGKMLFSGFDDDNCVASMTPIHDHWNCSVYNPNSCSDYFATFGSSILNLWTLYTTANYPDVMMPAYNCSPFYSIFFILFIASGIYFILNFLIGYIYSFYEIQNKTNLLKVYDRIVCGLDAAFFTLCKSKETGEKDTDPDDANNQIITRTDFAQLMHFFRPDLDPMYVSLIYDAGVGGINNKQMNRTQFRLVMYNYGRITFTKSAAFILNNEKNKNKWWGIPHYCRSFIENKYVVGFNNSTLFSYFLLVIAQMCIEEETILSIVNQILSVLFYVFLVEYIFKVIGYGFVGYWNQGVNAKIETIVTPCSCLGTLISSFADPKDAFIARTLIILRLVRLVNVFKLNRQFQIFLSAFKQVINPLMRYVLVLLCAYYFYAIWGMEFFSGILDPNDYNVVSSSYGALNYYNNNFNNLARSFVTLFEQMVVNNWPVVMEGTVAATQNWVCRFFFILFYISTVMIVLNVITAFTLEVFNVVVEAEQNMKPGEVDPKTQKANLIASIAKERGIDLVEYNIKIPRWSMDLYTQIFQDALTKDIRQLEFGWHGDKDATVN